MPEHLLNDMAMPFFLLLLFAVAFLYSSVGHGGASGYLALMAIFGFAPDTMKSSALIMNVFVSLVAFTQYYRGGYFRWKLFLPFALASIPASFAGSLIHLDPVIYKRILGVLLIFPALRLFGFFGHESDEKRNQNNVVAILAGIVIGLFSGMIGIGGGIILSPLLLLLKWSTMKETAAISALFIFVNSIAGLAGIVYTGLPVSPSVITWVLIALAGGFAGSYLGSMKLNNLILKKVLASVLLLACLKLMIS